MVRNDPLMNWTERIPTSRSRPVPGGSPAVPFGLRYAVPRAAGKHEKTYVTKRTIEKTVNIDDGTRSEDSITVDREEED